MPKQLNVNLAFTADTGAAKAQIKSLEQDLKNLVSATGATKDFKLTKDLVQAKEAAGQLRLALQNATTSTGTLDLSKFDQAIKASGMKLSEYRQHLSSLGPAGQQAFAKMAQSIIQAEVPLRKTNALLDNLKTTMINTARWQLSSSMLHGFMGALQSAYGYAQDLNSSLNNIRIVTGASVDEMTAFADRANKAAQALSTSTTQYTDAALIYYQQGIRDQEEIAGRTETTIKLANVSRQSAEEVSQQMTAIWNNFYDGSKSLEYYADAITALGATTASSSQEIATGLEKFAAISKTVGLSYEYATAALATITAQTRQSADTVGTGLRTLFSRLEGLKLGETLEDGVDLNKYSQALEAVGVQVLDVSGDMRNMDDILNDLGARWGDLTQAQKMALAQTVGGVRQYTNLIALMDNWDKMQQNVLTAQGSEGTLQEQADIYAESWEAAQKRVKAAAQALYSDLLDDKFFIGLANGFAKILQGVDGLIDGIGGLRTLLPGVLLLFNQLWGKQMSQNIDNMIFNMSRNTDAMQKQIAAQKQEAYNEASAMFKGSDTYMGQAQEQALKSQLDLSFQLQGAAKNLTAEEIQRYQASIDTVSAIQDQVVALGQAADAANKAKDAQIDALTNKAIRSGGTIEEKQTKLDQSQIDLQNIEKQVTASTNASKALQNLQDQYSKGEISALGFAKAIKGIQADLRNAGFDRYGASVQTLQKAVNAAKTSTQAFDEQIKKIVKDKGFENNAYIDTITHMENLANQYGWTAEDCEKYLNILHKNIDAGMEFGQAQEIAAEAVQKLKDKITNAESAMQTLGTTGQTIVQIFSGMSQFMMGLSSIVNVFETLSNPDISGLEKFKTVIMGLSLGLPMLIKGGQSLINTFKSINTAIEGATVAQIKNTAATEADTIVSGKNLIVKGMMKAAELLQIGLLRLRLGAQAALTAMEGEATVVTWLLTAAVNALNISLSVSPVMLLVAALVALVAIGGIVVGVVKAISNAWNAHNTAAENAETAAANLQKQFQETKQAYDDLKASIEDYESAYDAIGQLQKGTQEWKDAIRESNTQALELINTLGLLKDQDYQIDNDGAITFTAKGQEKIDNKVAEQSAAVDTAQMSAFMGEATAKQLRAQADAENIARDSGQYAVVNSAIDKLVNGELKDDFSKNALSDEDLKRELDINDDELIASIKENAQAQLQAADMYTMAAEESAKVFVDNNKEIQSSGYTEEITKAAGHIYEQAYDASYDKYSESLSLGISETVFEDYAQKSGLDQLKGFKSEGGGKYSYLDETGQKQKAEVTADEIAMTLAAADAERQLSETSTGLVDAFKELDEAGTVGGQALKKFLTDGNLNGASKSELDMVSAHTKNGTQTADYLGKTLGGEDEILSDEEAQALGYDSAQVMVEAFNEGLSNAQDNIANAGKDLIPSFMQDAFEAVSENSDLGVDSKTAIASAIDNALSSGGNEAAKKLMNQFMEASQAGELTDKKIQEIIASAEELSAVDLETLTSKIAEINSIISGLETGDSISADDYAKLSEEQQSYFAMAMDGTYQLIGSAEELKEITEQTNFEKFKEMSGEAATTAHTYDSAMGVVASSGVEGLSESAYMGAVPGSGGQSISFDSSLLETQLGLIQEYQDQLNISNTQLAEWQENLQNGMVDPSMLEAVASAVGDIGLSEEELAQKATEATDKQIELQTAMALSAENTNELQQMFDEGVIGAEAFNAGMEKIHNTLDEDIDKEQYEELSEYFEEFGDEIDGVSKEMKGNKKASRELAKEISRFDAAVESVGDNYNDWMSDLKKGEKNSTSHAKTIKGLRNAYGDLLDVSGDTLSKSFLENAKNLDLMAKAAQGDEEAYKELAKAARQDIIANANMSDEDFQAGFQDLMNKYYEGQNLDDIEVGAQLNDEGFLQGLTNMVNQAGMTAQQATDYLASMGVDAEVITDSSPTTETTEVVGYNATPHTASVSYSIPKVSGSGEDMSVSTTSGTATFPYFTVSEDVNTVTTTKENSATSLKVTSASKSSGGGFKASHGGGGGGGGGGGCFVAGTLVSTNHGFIPIEKIQPGDVVLSYNEQTQNNEYCTVLNTMIHFLWTKLYTIYTGDESIQATGIHRFYIKRAGKAQWLPASELRINDLVFLSSGKWQVINEIKCKRTFRKVYNFEVDNNHNYYITQSEILVHNKGCFVAGTLITTQNGFENIENIKPGDIVLSYNEQTKQNEYSKVIDTMIHRLWTDLYILNIDDEIIKVTDVHRFYILRNGQINWIPASELQVLDLVLYADGTWHKICKINKVKRFRKVYNFEVSNNHNYYVSKKQVLVHNKGCFVANTLIATEQGFKNIQDIQIGDIVLSYNEQTQQNEYSEVAQTMTHFVHEHIYKLYIGTEILQVTGIHRFFINRNNEVSWIHAENLQVGDLVLYANGIWNEIFKIESTFKFRKVYNFEVSGNHNYYVSKTQILAHNKGGGGRQKERAQGRARSDAERYHVVRNQLGVLDKQYDKIGTAFDRAFGKDKLKLLDDRIAKQKQLIATQQKYVDEIQRYWKIDKANLSQKGKGVYKYWSETAGAMQSVKVNSQDYLGKKVQFDAGGSITNYEDLVKTAEKKLEAARQAWNKSAQTDANKKAWEKAQAQYEGFMEMMSQYEETNDLLLEETNNLIQKQNELYDMRLEKTELRLKLRIDVADSALDFLSNLLDQVGDSAYNAANRIALIGQQLQADRAKITAYDKDIKGLFANHGFTGTQANDLFKQLSSKAVDAKAMSEKLRKDGSWTESEIENLRNMVDGYLEANSQLMEYRRSVIEEIGNVMDENIDRLDRITDKMEYLNNLSNSYKNIIDLTGRSYLKVSSEVYNNVQRQNTQLSAMSLSMANTRRVQAIAQYNTMVKGYEKVRDKLSAQEREDRERQIQEAADYMQEMTQSFYESWEAALEAVNEQFDTTMETMMEDFNSTMAKNAGNLEGLSDMMSLKKEVADTYVPVYEKMYQLNKLASEAQKSIDQTSNVKVQRELQQIQQKILDARSNQNKMSQYQIDFLKKELELKQAQLALEEAQDAKSQVRMTRDSEGNYSYVYTADQDKVQQAEDNYNAKLYEMQKLNDEYINDIQEKLVSLQSNYIESIAEAAETYGKGTEAYYRAVSEIQAAYNEQFQALGGDDGELAQALENQAFTQEHYAGIYTQLTGDMYQANIQLTTSWEDTLLKAETGYGSLKDYQTAWSTASAEAYKTALTATEEWKNGMDLVYKLAGASTTNFGDQATTAMEKISKYGAETVTEMTKMAVTAQTAITQVEGAVSNWEKKFSQIIEDRIAQNNQLIANINNVVEAWYGLNSLDMNDALVSTMSLEEIGAMKADAEKRYQSASKNKDRARTTMDTARTAMNTAATKYGVTSLKKAQNRITTAKNAKAKAAKARGVRRILDNKRRINDLTKQQRRYRKNSRRWKDLQKRKTALSNANKKLLRNRTIRRNWDTYKKKSTAVTNARKTFDTKLKRASRTVRSNWSRYRTAVRRYNDSVTAYRAANTRYTNAQNTYDYWKKQYDRMANDTNASANVDTSTQALNAASLGSVAETNANATAENLNGITVAPVITVSLPKDLNQHVEITASFPEAWSGEEIQKAFIGIVDKSAQWVYGS